MKEIWMKYKSIFFYLVFGVGTTVVNIASYAFFARICGLNTVVSNILAWILAVLFAYITNKLWVFESKCTKIEEVINEIIKFFSCRLLTGIVDLIIMYVFVDKLSFDDILIKCVSNVIVIILNYVASKIFVFKKEET